MAPRTRRSPSQPATSPTARRWELARRLKELRVSRGLGLETVAAELMCSAAKVSRMETAQRRIQPRDVRDLCRFYGVDVEAREELMQLASEASATGWWDRLRTLPAETSDFIGLESAATETEVFHPTVVPGLFQTEEYAAALTEAIRAPGTWREDEKAELVQSRLNRRERVLDQSLIVRAVIDEVALLRCPEGDGLLERQTEWLVELASLPNVSLQVVPVARRAYPGVDGGFQWLGFAQEFVTSVVFVEGLLGVYLLEKATEADRYRENFSFISSTFALDPDQTIDWLRSPAATRLTESPHEAPETPSATSAGQRNTL